VLLNYWISFIFKLDGFIARKYNMKTMLGTVMDPAADKVLMTIMTITLAMKKLLPSKYLIKNFFFRPSVSCIKFYSSNSHSNIGTRRRVNPCNILLSICFITISGILLLILGLKFYKRIIAT